MWRKPNKKTTNASRGSGQLVRRAHLRLTPLEDRLAPAILYVTTTDDVVDANDSRRSLREAITQANNNPGADVIVLAAGEYKIAIAGDDPLNVKGDFDIRDPLTIVGKGAALTKIDGANVDRVFEVVGNADAPINVNFRGLTITGGGQVLNGGGILVWDANVSLRGCVVTKNNVRGSGGGIASLFPDANSLTMIGSTVSYNVAEGGDGGGIYLPGAKVTAWSSFIAGNNAEASGGGIVAATVNLTSCRVNWNVSAEWGGGMTATTVTLTRCDVSDNEAHGAGGGVHGGLGGITLTNSNVARNVSNVDGGGVFVVDGSLTAVRSVLRGNYAEHDGGGIYTGTATLAGCVVDGNVASRFGGGIYAGLTGTLTGCTVSNNLARDAGGGIYAGDAILSNSTVVGNGAETFGGGIRAVHVNLSNCIVSGNFANQHQGGGIYASDTADLINSTVRGNSAGSDGGGIRAFKSTTLTNSTICGNRAEEFGGGVYTDEGNFINATVAKNVAGYGGGVAIWQGSFLNVTIAENIARYGGGGVHRVVTTGTTVTVENSLIALNKVTLRISGAAVDVSGTFDSQGHNLIGAVNGATGFGAPGDLLGSKDDPLDPLLGELRNNGGKTQTYALLAGSKAIDAGDNAGAPTFDQRGIRRPRDGNRDGRYIVDIGAFER